MIFSTGSRQRDVQRAMVTWEPLIGSEATLTALRSRWSGQAGAAILILWVATNITMEATNWTGLPIAVAAFVAWPAILVLFGRAIKLSSQASRQAGAVAGTSPKARPPVNTVGAFDRWRARSRYAKSGPPQ